MRGEEDMACALFLRVHLVICCVSAVRKDGFQTLRPRRLDERPRRIGDCSFGSLLRGVLSCIQVVCCIYFDDFVVVDVFS